MSLQIQSLLYVKWIRINSENKGFAMDFDWKTGYESTMTGDAL